MFFSSISKNKIYLLLIIVLVSAIGIGFFDWSQAKQFKLGLDLRGGVHLVYQADLSGVDNERDAMQGVRDVIERRINMFGLAEPVVQIAQKDRLIVELAGVKDPAKAIELIGQTPSLDFRTEEITELENTDKDKTNKDSQTNQKVSFKRTALTGKNLKSSSLSFDPTTSQPIVNLKFDKQGKDLFAKLTQENIGKRIAIFLDEVPISIPVVKEKIDSGNAVISGNFNIKTAKTLVQRLNAGALPVPIKLLSQETIGATLGKESLDKSFHAGLIGLIAIALFMLIFYRLNGVLASLALAIYGILMLGIFKAIPVTMTLSGIAGFILSIGMAIDANVLIFERLKEENFLDQGFSRAWPAIRDGNISTLFTCLVLYLFTVGLVKGFAITLGIGVLISMFSAMIVTRLFLEVRNSREVK